MKRNNIVGGIFFLTVGLIFAVYSKSVDIGDWSEPGAGFLPFYGGLIVIGMSLLLVVGSFVRVDAAVEPFFPESDSWKRVLSTFLALVAYNVLLRQLGFALVTFLFVGFLVKFIFPQGWWKSLATAALATVCVQLVFVNLLEINFPKGILGF
ncbi:MAG: tripartite tricarboxylate transporter TctB family protein [Deltaproteobacteria bacterium]|nr:MAG: tripartite tricarboxylate transporter TctB family protein [Deltaproteobacteria bacterium]